MAEKFDLITVLETLIYIAKLSPNWDRDQTLPIDRNVIASAVRLASNLPEDLQVRPCVAPTNRGRVQFEWHRGHRSLKIEIGPDEGSRYIKWNAELGIEEEGPIAPGDDAAIASLLKWFGPGSAGSP